MISKVYILRFTRVKQDIISSIKLLLKAAQADKAVEKGDIVAVKVHMGERGNFRHPRPQIVRAVVDFIKNQGGKPFVTDTTTLYHGYRGNAVDYLETAAINGFTYATLGCPIIIADGLYGRDFREVEVGGPLGKVAVASAIAEADAMFVISHVKLHISFGFGGALKNLAMGCTARKSKFAMHSPGKPEIDVNKCVGCGICKKHCRWNAIEIVEGKAKINYEKCVGCGDCLTYCPRGAVKISWDRTERIQRLAAWAALGVLKTFREGKVFYINLVMEVTSLCDCATIIESPIIPDLGVLASYDPVAIDQASMDLVNEAPGIIYSKDGFKIVESGYDKVKIFHPERRWQAILEEAERIGLGTRKYKLIEV